MLWAGPHGPKTHRRVRNRSVIAMDSCAHPEARKRSSSFGSTVPAISLKQKLLILDSGVELGLISTIVVPLAPAVSASPAAGHTSDDVPIEKNKSQSDAACMASCSAISGIASPNQTTPGRRLPPHSGQVGTSLQVSIASFTTQPSTKQRSSNRLP